MKLIDAIRAAGFSGQAAETMAAIEEAESGGNAWAYNPNAGTGDNSYGLAQINMIGTLGPARRAQFGLSSNDQLFDPATNEKAAYAISDGGTNFAPWSTFKSGAYQQYLGVADGLQITQTPENGSPHTDPGYSGTFPAPSPSNMNGSAAYTAATASDTSPSSSSSGLSWSDLLPWNWGNGVSSIAQTVINFTLKLAFVGGGIALVLFGAYRASGPARENIESAAAPLAAAAA